MSEHFEIRGRDYDLSHRALLVGILNVTPDSFSDGGRFVCVGNALGRARYLAGQGADVIDVGGESTRPGARPVSLEEELKRVVPVIEAIRSQGLQWPLTVDTQKAEVARRALEAGADAVNDVSGLVADPEMIALVAEKKVPVVIMHNRGASSKMYERAEYADVAGEVRAELEARMQAALSGGIAPERIVLDPGIGFAKRSEQSWQALDGVARIVALGRPVLVGTSRKSFLREVFGGDRAALERGTQATAVAALLRGARLLRVHEPGPFRALALCRHAGEPPASRAGGRLGSLQSP